MISMINTSNILKNRDNDRDSYDINKAVKHISENIKKGTQEKNSQVGK